MKSAYLKLAVIFFVLPALSGCQKTYVVSKSQAVLFQVEYLNSSDARSLRGFFVDVKGNILCYNSPEKWNFPADDETIGKNELLENLASTTIIEEKVPSEELQKYINYIDNIAASKVTLPKIHSSDSGTLSYYCYQYSDGSQEYKRTILKTEGHVNCENLNFFTKKVVSWMNEIEKTTSM